MNQKPEKNSNKKSTMQSFFAEDHFSFILLLAELKLYILRFATIQTIGRFAQTSHNYSKLTQTQSIYQQLIHRDLTEYPILADGQFFKDYYAEYYRRFLKPLNKVQQNITELSEFPECLGIRPIQAIINAELEVLLDHVLNTIPKNTKRQEVLQYREANDENCSIHIAAKSKNNKLMLRILKEFPQQQWQSLMFIPNKHGCTALHKAAEAGSMACVLLALQYYSTSEWSQKLLLGDNTGATSLHYAVNGKHMKMVQFVLDKIDTELRLSAIMQYGDQKTCLHLAVNVGNLEGLELLLSYLTPEFYQQICFERDGTGRTAFEYVNSMRSNSVKFLYALLSSLPLSVIQHQPDLLKTILPDYHTNKLINEAVQMGHLAAIKIFFQIIPDHMHVEVITSPYQWVDERVIHVAAGACNPELLEFLLSKIPANHEFYSLTNRQGYNPLHCAALLADFVSVGLLLRHTPKEKHAEVILQQAYLNKTTTLHVAVNINAAFLLISLLRQLSPIEFLHACSLHDSSGQTFLHEAAADDNASSILAIFEIIPREYVPVVVCIRDKKDISVLQYMAQSKSAEKKIISLLKIIPLTLHHHLLLYETLYLLANNHPIIKTCMDNILGQIYLAKEAVFYAIRKNNPTLIQDTVAMLNSVFNNNNDMMREIIEVGLIKANQNGLNTSVQTLLAIGKFEIGDDVWLLALHFAKRRNNTRMVQLLLDYQKPEMAIHTIDREILTVECIRDGLEYAKKWKENLSQPLPIWLTLCKLSVALNKQGYHREDITILDDVIWLNPFFVRAIVDLGTLQYNSNQSSQAIGTLSDAISIDPEFAIPYFCRGIVLFETKQYEKAIVDFDLAILYGYQAFEVHITRGDCKLKCNNFKSAISDFDYVLHLAPENVQVYAKRAYCYFCLDLFEEAIADYTEHIQQTQGNIAESYKSRGLAYFNIGYYQAALDDFMKYTKLVKVDITIIRYTGLTFYFLGYYYHASAIFRKTAKKIPNDAVLHCYQGFIYYIIACYEKAMKKCERAIQINPKDYLAFQLRASILCKLKQYAKAIDDYRIALTLNPQDGYSHYKLAKLKLAKIIPKDVVIREAHATQAYHIYQQRVKKDNNFTCPANFYRLGRIFECGIGVSPSTDKARFSYSQTIISKGDTIWHKKAEIRLGKLPFKEDVRPYQYSNNPFVEEFFQNLKNKP